MVAVWFMCGNSYGLGGEVSTEQCDTPCPLGPGKCGGLLRSSVYQTTAPGGSYLGCFIDNEERDLPLLIQVSSSNTMSLCKKSCSATGILRFKIYCVYMHQIMLSRRYLFGLKLMNFTFTFGSKFIFGGIVKTANLAFACVVTQS